ncbi:hypothetical protein PIB30_110698, partial [Stylosanthes scabra]|nr:hypothetical protein [Stylosanthes scabra]
DLQAGSEAEAQPEVQPEVQSEVQPEVEAHHEEGILIGNEQQHDPLTVEAPFQPEQPSTPQHNEVDDPVLINME